MCTFYKHTVLFYFNTHHITKQHAATTKAAMVTRSDWISLDQFGYTGLDWINHVKDLNMTPIHKHVTLQMCETSSNNKRTPL